MNSVPKWSIENYYCISQVKFIYIVLFTITIVSSIFTENDNGNVSDFVIPLCLIVVLSRLDLVNNRVYICNDTSNHAEIYYVVYIAVCECTVCMYTCISNFV